MGVLSPITGVIRTVKKLGSGGDGQRDERWDPQQNRDVHHVAESVHKLQVDVEIQIQVLSIVLSGMITRYEYDKLHGLTESRSFMVRWRDEMKDELDRLDALGYVKVTYTGGVEQIAQEQSDAKHEFDLKQYVQITDHGHRYLKLRHQYDRAGE